MGLYRGCFGKHVFPELFGRNSRVFFEKETEMTWCGKVQFFADLGNRFGNIHQQDLGTVQDSHVQPLLGRFFGGAFYGIRQIVLRDAHLLGVKTDAVLLKRVLFRQFVEVAE